ncbi:MAG: branched-chain amino acid ABC transporter permease [Gaiellaceae bacterium]
MSDLTPPTPGSPLPVTGQIGVDTWVSEAEERRLRRAGTWGHVLRAWERLPPPGKLALVTPAIAVPFIPVVSSGNLFNYGIFILLYALLGLGLNVVVGFAGLLDLGYVAFFGFGAYTYAFLSGTHVEKGHAYTHHWPAELSIPLAIVVCGLLGVFLGSSSRRLLGDYLAIVTLFFGEAFVVFTNSADPRGITNGSNGLANIDALRFSAFGHEATIASVRGYYWFLLGCVLVVLVVVHFLSESRTGRAWKASREDPLAAELMGMPVHRLKIMAFALGAGIAGLAGTVFAAAQTGAFPQNFSTQVLILIYAVVILGGAGSLTGMLVGSAVILASNQVLDSTSPPNLQRVLFFLALIIGFALMFRSSWRKLAVVTVATIGLGFAVHAIAAAWWPRGVHRSVTSGGFLTGPIKHWVLLPANPSRIADYAYLLVIVLAIALSQLKGWWRVAVAPFAFVLTAFVWENLLIQQPAVTRYVLFGALLIALMAIRPQGLFGTAKVEIV